MKTNVIMVRQMGDYLVNQRTKDEMFNASHLAHQWEIKTGTIKKISDFLRLNQTQDFINVLSEEENLLRGNSLEGNNQAYRTIKGKYTRTGRGSDEVWMHPYLFIKFAMWLNPKFEYHVIKFVYDSLIALRKETSDIYGELCNAVNMYHMRTYNKEATIENYKDKAIILQFLVFGRTFPGNPWQDATESQLRLRKNLQSIMIGCFNKDYDMNRTKALLEAQVEIYMLNEK
jgi:hypothetical protein